MGVSWDNIITALSSLIIKEIQITSRELILNLIAILELSFFILDNVVDKKLTNTIPFPYIYHAKIIMQGAKLLRKIG